MATITASRPPLGDTTNSPPPSPPETIRISGHTLHRKPTRRALNANIDSSESVPSAHTSLYEASRENSLPDQALTVPIVSEWNRSLPEFGCIGEASWIGTVCGPDGSPVPTSFLQPISASQKDHIPHELYPITERNSLATLRSRFSVCSTATLRARARSPGLAGRHKKSFSLTDLPAPMELQHSSSESSAPAPPSPLPQPNRPIYFPPRRSPTPPNLPSFGKPEAINYRLPPPPKPKRLRDRLSTPTTEELEWRRQTIGLPKGVVMRGEGGVLIRGKFNGIRSGHFPPQRQHHEIMSLPPPMERPVETWLGRPTTTGAARSGPNGRRLDGGSQVDAARRIENEIAASIEAERRDRRARRKELAVKILLFCCPRCGEAGNDRARVAGATGAGHVASLVNSP